MIEARSLTKLYGIVIGVNDITLDLSPGVHGLLGPNGSGKSTFLKLLTGQLRPTEGTVRVCGQRPWNNPGLFHDVGYCPQQDSFYMFLTGFEFVSTLARMSGLDRRAARAQAESALERAGATGFMHRKIATYSKGMRQRTKVAQALVNDPSFLIFDEPLTGTDPIGRRDLMDLIVGLGNEGKSVLVSSHVLHEVDAMTREFLLIHGGRVLASGNVDEIRSVLDEVPHRILISCRSCRELAHRLMRDLPIQGVKMDEARGEVSILTNDPAAFYRGLAKTVNESGVEIREVRSQDDDLEAVFKTLIARI